MFKGEMRETTQKFKLTRSISSAQIQLNQSSSVLQEEMCKRDGRLFSLGEQEGWKKEIRRQFEIHRKEI